MPVHVTNTNRPCPEGPAVGLLDDETILALSPIFRLRNEYDHVKLYGWNERGHWRLHRAVGIALSLFNGKRTLGEISELVVPLVEKPDAEDAPAEARRKVWAIADRFQKSRSAQEGKLELRDEEFPSDAALVPASLLPEFGRLRAPEYNPRRFLAQYAYEPGKSDFGLERERVPNIINWHLTSTCAVNCRYCYLGRRDIQSSQFLPFDRARELIEECDRIGVFAIDPSGGDVLLYPRLFDFLDRLHEYPSFLPIRVATKAYLSKKTARKLAEYPRLYSLQFSIDSTVPEVADYLTRTPGFSARALESIDNALEAGVNVTTKSVITPYNIVTIPRLYRELRQRGVKRVILASYCRSGYHHSDALFNDPESYNWLESEVEALRKEFPHDFLNIQNGSPRVEAPSRKKLEDAWLTRVLCTAGRRAMMICADGKVIPCEQMPETEESFCGDVRVQSIREVWDSKELEERTIHMPREKFRGSPCHECAEFDECIPKHGYCIRDTSQFFGALYTTPSNCPKCERPYLRTV